MPGASEGSRVRGLAAGQLAVRVVAEGMPAAAFTEWMRDPARLAPRPDASGYPSASEAGHRGLASGPAARVACTVRSAVQPVGWAALAVAVTILAAYGLWQVFRWGGREHQALIGDLALISVIGVAAVLAGRASRRADLGRNACRAWRRLALAMILCLAGVLLQLAYEVVLHKRAYPTWADVAYLSFYPVAFGGLMSFPHRRRSRPERMRLLLDMGMVFTSGATLIWYAALGPVIATGGGGFGLLNLVTYAYPVGDLLLLYGVLAALARGPSPSSVLALRILAVAMLSFVAGAIIYDRITVHSADVGGDPAETLWMVGVLLVCLAAVCQVRTRPAGILAPLPRPAPLQPSFLPYLAMASTFLLLAVLCLPGVRFCSLGGILLGAVALASLVSARQYIVLHDTGRLTIRYQELASVDGMTGLYNRGHFMGAAEAAFASAQRLGQPLVALMIDVDNFKQINDTHGHSAGDRVLAEMAQACREQVRPGDIVGRYGGDEFVIIIVGITSLRAAQIADQLARPAARSLGRDGEPLTCSASIGIAESLPGWDLPALLTHADQAMYEAKRAGGGNWHIYEDSAGATQAVTSQAAASARRVDSHTQRRLT